MYSLYHSLLAQHPRQLLPMPCAASTIAELHRYFEDVVLENNLSALVVENLPTSVERPPRDIARIEQLDQTAKDLFLWVSPQDALANLELSQEKGDNKSVLLERTYEGNYVERFVIVADARFAALLASVQNSEAQDESGDLVIWTFEPDVVYSALEYLMARITAEHSPYSNTFERAVRASVPKATSLHLTLGVTTKLARLLQKQAERETAVNRLATAIRNSLDLESVLQTAANEVGRALNVHSCAVRVNGPLVGRQMTKCYLRSNVAAEGEESFLKDVDLISNRLARLPQPFVVEGDASKSPPVLADAAVPLTHQGNVIGLLLVRSDDLSHGWAENELLLLHTAADQLAVAVQQAEMYEQIREQALTDSLTGCYNRRSLELRLDHNIQMAIRTREPLSVLMLDLDNFKQINDQAGHDTGDVALCMLADTLRGGLRAVDTAARFGGDEFVIILPQANTEGAMVVAERLRRRIAQIQVPGFGHMTSSVGVATFPNHASSKATLMLAADRALYDAKYSGRNRVNIVDTATLGKVGPSIELVDAMQRL